MTTGSRFSTITVFKRQHDREPFRIRTAACVLFPSAHRRTHLAHGAEMINFLFTDESLSNLNSNSRSTFIWRILDIRKLPTNLFPEKDYYDSRGLMVWASSMLDGLTSHPDLSKAVRLVWGIRVTSAKFLFLILLSRYTAWFDHFGSIIYIQITFCVFLRINLGIVMLKGLLNPVFCSLRFNKEHSKMWTIKNINIYCF